MQGKEELIETRRNVKKQFHLAIPFQVLIMMFLMLL
jgi:hypothetical protein